MISVHRHKNRRMLVILILVGFVSYSFCNFERSKSSLLKFLAFGEILAMILVKNFLSYLLMLSQFESISVSKW